MRIIIDAPAITGYTSGFPSFWLNLFFVAKPSSCYKVNALATTFVRLVEAALTEYKLGIAKLHEYWGMHSSPNIHAMFCSICHLETCLFDMHRATQCYRKLRKNKDPLAAELNSEKPGFNCDSVASRIANMRDMIYHVEGSIFGDKKVDQQLQADQIFTLMPTGPEIDHPTEANQTIKTIDRLVIGTHEIRFAELATWIEQMAKTAQRIADFTPRALQTPAS